MTANNTKLKKDIHTYSHTFHLSLNSFHYMDNLPDGINTYIKVDTNMFQKKNLRKKTEESILGLFKKIIKRSGIFYSDQNIDRITISHFWKSSINRALKEDVKSICEELSLEIPSFYYTNLFKLFRHNNFNKNSLNASSFNCPSLGYNLEAFLCLTNNIKRVIK